MYISEQEAEIILKALDSYIRRKLRDYNHAQRQGAKVKFLQSMQAKIEAASELRESIMEEKKNGGFLQSFLAW